MRVHIQDENDNTPTFVRSAYFFRVNENEDISTVVAPQNTEIVARDNDIGDNAVIEFQLSGDGKCTGFPLIQVYQYFSKIYMG